MPRTYGYRRRRKRTYRKRGRTAYRARKGGHTKYSGALSTRNNLGGGFPDKMLVRMKAGVIDTWEPAGTTNHWKLQLNGLFGTYATAGFDAAQPWDFDRFASVYMAYYVPSGSYKITLINTTTSHVNVGWYVDSDSAACTSIRMAMEKGSIKSLGATDENMKSKAIIYGKWTRKQVVDKWYDTLTSLYNADPATPIYLHVYGSSAANINCQIWIECIYTVKWWNKMAGSVS